LSPFFFFIYYKKEKMSSLTVRKNPTVLHLIDRVRETQGLVQERLTQINAYMSSQQVASGISRKQALTSAHATFGKMGGMEAAKRIKELLDKVSTNLVDILYFLRNTSDFYSQLGRIVKYIDHVEESLKHKQTMKYTNMENQRQKLEESFAQQSDINIGYYLRCFVTGACSVAMGTASAIGSAMKRRRQQ
jgi:hypothetical protein